jgi:hypothetical protein
LTASGLQPSPSLIETGITPRQGALPGLGVSLDWLVFGAEGASKGVELIADRACNKASRLFAETLLKYHHANKGPVIQGERILNLKPEAWGEYFGEFASEQAASMLSEGVTLEELLRWKQQETELSREMFLDMIEERLPEALSSTKAAFRGRP